MCVHAVLHTEFRGCGGFVFFVDHEPVTGEVVRVESIRQLDGTPPIAGSKITCGTCGGPCAPSSDTVFVGHLEHLGDFGTSPVGAA